METPEWAPLTGDAVLAFADPARAAVAAMTAHASPDEAAIRRLIIEPLIETLRWFSLPEQRGARSSDVADALLYPDDVALTAARAQPPGSPRRSRPAQVIPEHKVWQVPLDRTSNAGSPAGQRRRHLCAAAERSDRALTWGLLTNARVWHLHHGGVGPQGGQTCVAALEGLLALGRFRSRDLILGCMTAPAAGGTSARGAG